MPSPPTLPRLHLPLPKKHLFACFATLLGCVWVCCVRAQGTVQQIANGDLMRPLLIECWDYDRAGDHDFIGGCNASIADMQVGACSLFSPFVRPSFRSLPLLPLVMNVEYFDAFQSPARHLPLNLSRNDHAWSRQNKTEKWSKA